MIIKLFVTFIESIGRPEERDRIGDVDSNGNFEFTARVPHGIEPGIIDFHQCSGGDVLAQIKTQSLENLESSSAIALRRFDSFRLKLWIVGLFESRVRRLGKGVKASRKGTVVFTDSLD